MINIDLKNMDLHLLKETITTVEEITIYLHNDAK